MTFREVYLLNKQRFLTELRRLLIFMTESDRNLTVNQYAAMFDEAGEQGEQALLEQLGSPTKLAISLSRGYQPGQLTTETKQREVLKKAEDAAKAARLGHLDDDYNPVDLEDNDPVAILMRSLDEPEASDEPDEEPEIELDEGLKIELGRRPEADDTWDDDETDDLWDDEADDEPLDLRYERVGAAMPQGAGVTLLTVILLVIGVPLAALVLGVAAVWLIPGAAGLGTSLLSAIAALWCLNYLADTLLVLGVAFAALALGLLLLWCGIWLDVHLVGLYVRGVQWLCGKLLGKKVRV